MNQHIKHLIKTFVLALVLIAILYAYKENAHGININNQWSKSTYDKLNNLISIWVNKQYSIDLINVCKANAKDPVRCIKLHIAILWAESSLWQNCNWHNCIWMWDWFTVYKNSKYAIEDWVKRYNKYWYKQTDPSGFYRDDGIPPKTHYCMWPKKDWVCKNGTKNAWKTWNKLKF